MKLTSLKYSKKEKKNGGDMPVTASGKGPDYPYGLRIDLGKECLKKLGLTVKDFKMGSSFEITAKVDVAGAHWNDGEYGKDEGVFLQITDMAIPSMKGSKYSEYAKESKKGPGE